MKKLCVVLSFLLVSQFVFAGIEFIGVDGVETTFDVASGELTIFGEDLVITIDDGTGVQTSVESGIFLLVTNLVDAPTGHFEGGDFIFVDSLGGGFALGVIVEIDFAEVFGLMVGSGSADIDFDDLTGNDLEGAAEIVSISFMLDPGFTGFEADFTALTKIDIVVPEPATLGLLAIGATLLRRKKK